MKYSSFIYLFLTFFISTSAITIVSCQEKDQEPDVTAKEIPRAVQQSFDQAYPGATIKGYSEEMEDGQTFYEVSCTFEGRKIDALYHPDGSVAAIEEVIPESQIPLAIKQGFATKVKNGTITLAEKIEKEGKLLYELKVVNNDNGEHSEMVFSDAGKLIKIEVKKTEDKEGEEEREEEESEEMHETASTDVTIPDAVKAAFNAKFPEAEKVEWGMESETEYEAEFEMNEMNMSANFDPNGMWLETETILPEKKLPVAIQTALKKDFIGYEVEKVEKLEKAGEPVLYEIKLEKGESVVEAIMNEAGELIKKEVKNEEED